MISRTKSVRKVPAVSTASLPDIVFILLFFFMTVTVIKDTTIMVENELPLASESEKLALKEGVITLHIGKPLSTYKPITGVQPQIQMGDSFGRSDEVKAHVLRALSNMPEHLRNKAVVMLKVDQGVGMGLIDDIKESLRDVNLLKINYATVGAITP